MHNLNYLNDLSYKYFVTADAGRIQNTMSGEVDRVARAFLTYFTAFQAGVMVMVYMFFAFTIDMKFAFLVSIGGILTNLVFKTIYKNTKGRSRELTGENNKFQSLIIQHVANYKYLKATGTLKVYAKKLRKSIKKIESSNKKIGKLGGFLNASREPIIIVVVVSVIYIQTQLLGSPLAPILISLLFFYRALSFLMQMQNQWNKFLGVSGSMENMTLFTSELKKNQIKNISTTFLKSEIKEIEVIDGYFSYGSNEVLVDINLKIQQKETVAFVGESGSGKTTLVNILSGLLRLNRGSLLINNQNAVDINLESYQKRIGYITQDPVIFNDSLFNNITFWDEKNELNLKRFEEVIERSALSSFYRELPERGDSILENAGINLSGGQKQRISIARELYKNVELMIMDEATSALDSETEKQIQENIENLQGSYTFFMVAHRLSTIKNADRIIVMKEGKIESIGNFHSLMEKSKYFHQLVSLQEL